VETRRLEDEALQRQRAEAREIALTGKGDHVGAEKEVRDGLWLLLCGPGVVGFPGAGADCAVNGAAELEGAEVGVWRSG
jgi:hypothetical protein